MMAVTVAAALVGAAGGVCALPLGGQITSGAGGVATSGATLTVNQASQNLALNWKSFGIAANETVNFVQPNASAIALNRVLGSDASAIYGKLNANGQVFLINPNGILFGQSAQVNVGGLVASTLALSGTDFNAGKRTFRASGNVGDVTNLGNIVANGGYIAFLGGQVSNQGTLQATLGTVALAAGSQTTLDFAGDKLIKVQVNEGALQALADNGQLIQADGGTVILTAKAAGSLVAGVVNNSGLIQARTLASHAGVISLLGDMQSGLVNVGGTLDASAPAGGNGGFIETSAAHVNVANNAIITTAAAIGMAGTWLIDPVDFTIAASGGNITGATLSTELGGGNVSILSSSGTTGTAGNVNVNDAVTWSANQLTLNAQNNININANLNGSGTASLALQYGQGAGAAGNASTYNLNNGAQVNLSAGKNFSTKLGSDGGTVNYTVITSLGAAGSTTTTDLQGMNGNLAGNYVLGANIDATATSSWNSGAGFTPIGGATASDTATNPFTGTFDGLGHTIGSLSINLPSKENVGLFGYAETGSAIRNVGLVGGSVSGGCFCNGGNEVGELVGWNSGTISNSYATGSVSGSSQVGGLVGANSGTISNSYATGSVSGTNDGIGGLVGLNTGNQGTISNSYATGGVNGGSNGDVGGLVGANWSMISKSYATGSVSGGFQVGGLVGYNITTNVNMIDNSYAIGRVNGGYSVGGLVGRNTGTISNSYATGSVSGGSQVGGLVGYNYFGAGYFGDSINSYWNIATSGQSSSAGGTGLTTAQMMQLSSFTGWSISATGGSGEVWRIYEGQTAPLLISFLTPLKLTDAPDITVTYNGAPHTGSSTSISGVGILGSPAGTETNAGFYGFYSTQQGYDITGGSLIINPATLTVNGTTASNKVYDGNTTATLSGGTLNGVITGDTVSLSQSGTFATKNAGTNITVTATDGISGASAGNYTLIEPTGLAANIKQLVITPTAITVAATGTNKVYDGTVNDAVILSSTGVLSGDVVNFADTSATFANKNVGNNKIVTVTGITDSGADAGNYTLNNTTATTAANITPLAITVSATAANKVYNGTTKDTAKLASAGVIAGDVVKFTDTSVAFADKNVGNNKTVTVYGIKDSGKDAGNYTLTSTTTKSTGNITLKTITVTAIGVNKVYDGTVDDTVIPASTGVIKGDVVSFADTSATFANNAVANGKAVTISGITDSGTDAGNYKLSKTTAKAKADITP